jgi:hypothetical protein
MSTTNAPHKSCRGGEIATLESGGRHYLSPGPGSHLNPLRSLSALRIYGAVAVQCKHPGIVTFATSFDPSHTHAEKIYAALHKAQPVLLRIFGSCLPLSDVILAHLHCPTAGKTTYALVSSARLLKVDRASLRYDSFIIQVPGNLPKHETLHS